MTNNQDLLIDLQNQVTKLQSKLNLIYLAVEVEKFPINPNERENPYSLIHDSKRLDLLQELRG